MLTDDNVGHLSREWSDRLCRLCMGASQATRTLFTGDDLTILPSQASVILTGTGTLLARKAAIDRARVFKVARIPGSAT